ncbi:MAG: hypothetical protein WDM79_12570 [Terricaulis sp.]
MMKRTVLIVCLALAACSPAAPPPAGHNMDESPTASSGPGQVDADFGLRLGLLEGHMMVGRELIEAGQKENALPHFGHPIRELYGDLRPVIAERGAEQFEGDLVRAESLAALDGDTPEFRTAFDAAMAKVVAARATIPTETWNSDAYTLRLVSDLATTASQEYRNALVAGRIDSLVEYHDARGFMFYAAALLAAHQSSDPKLADAARIIGELKAMVEPLNPPNPPRATDAQFEAKAAELRALLAP